MKIYNYDFFHPDIKEDSDPIDKISVSCELIVSSGGGYVFFNSLNNPAQDMFFSLRRLTKRERLILRKRRFIEIFKVGI